ncbi:MAG TPA: hypothetical protein PK014_06565 [Thermoanaerobaculia bacterium]|nr:hypothetical protein [Thermoanaerobaculia bacterium]HUM29415.1 hypothetical protein [Thermoanaerobaculia bacterium]HXK67661.1 hypothetical protein [Thermoanaerobaculia bacterium]
MVSAIFSPGASWALTRDEGRKSFQLKAKGLPLVGNPVLPRTLPFLESALEELRIPAGPKTSSTWHAVGSGELTISTTFEGSQLHPYTPFLPCLALADLLNLPVSSTYHGILRYGPVGIPREELIMPSLATVPLQSQSLHEGLSEAVKVLQESDEEWDADLLVGYPDGRNLDQDTVAKLARDLFYLPGMRGVEKILSGDKHGLVITLDPVHGVAPALPLLTCGLLARTFLVFHNLSA